MVKKKYISPEMLTVQLGTVHMMAQSLLISNTNTITDKEEILVKEDNTITNVNVWDKEW